MTYGAIPGYLALRLPAGGVIPLIPAKAPGKEGGLGPLHKAASGLKRRTENPALQLAFEGSMTR